MMTPLPIRKMTVGAIAGLVIATTGSLKPACAADFSAWDDGTHSGARLVAGSRGGALVIGGIELRLAPNWKTYWRTPGDSGVPARFDFSASDNVANVTVLWPAPEAFSDGGGGQSIGYKQRVVLPVKIEPKDAAKPVTLRAQIDYAICEKLCVPADASLELTFDSTSSPQDRMLAQVIATVPKPARIGDANPLAIRSVRRDDGGKRVVVDVATPQGDQVRLFVEGPTPDWALPVPKREPSSPAGLARFSFALDGLPPDTDAKGAILTLTLADDASAYEIPAVLD